MAIHGMTFGIRVGEGPYDRDALRAVAEIPRPAFGAARPGGESRA